MKLNLFTVFLHRISFRRRLVVVIVVAAAAVVADDDALVRDFAGASSRILHLRRRCGFGVGWRKRKELAVGGHVRVRRDEVARFLISLFIRFHVDVEDPDNKLLFASSDHCFGFVGGDTIF